MKHYGKQPTLLQQALRSHIIQGVLTIFILFMLLQVYEQYQTTVQTGERRDTAEAEHEKLEQQQTALAEQVADLQDEYGIEAEIRRNFDVAREGEEVVIILEDSLTAVPSRDRAATSTFVTPATSSRPWYRFW